MTETESRPKSGELPAQALPDPAPQSQMQLQPDYDMSNYRPAEKLKDKVAIITGADSGIGRSVAIAFAIEGADVAIVYNENDGDAENICKYVEKYGRRCLKIKADVRVKSQCEAAIKETVAQLGKLNILVNNAAYQTPQTSFEDITEEHLRRVFDTNISGYFLMAQAAVPHLSEGDAIVNTGSTTALVGNPMLVGL